MASNNTTPLSFTEVDQTVLRTLEPAGRLYWSVIAALMLGMGFGLVCWIYQILVGIGAGGQNNPVNWGTYLINFVFWVGIAHSGTLISAILHLLRAPWRNPVARAAETMTVFAICTAGLFPLIHLGRVWMAFFLIPVPNQRTLWPNFQSPLIFDMVAIGTYLIVSVLFWYTGMLPDLAAIRDRASGAKKKIFRALALGWTGRFEQWAHYVRSYLLFAALATPLVISVHSVVSWDFALGVIPGWHTTIFAPYFVAGAIHSGLAMVLTLIIPLRAVFGYQRIITMDILEKVAQTIIFTGLIMGYSYATEHFIAWYSQNSVEIDQLAFRMHGPLAPQFWIMIVCNSLVPLLFFFRRFRRSLFWLFALSILVNIGMWFERYVIIIGGVAHDFLPHAFGEYAPSFVEYGIMLGTFCLFFFLFLLFVKHMPSVAMTEMKEKISEERAHGQ
jgi:molybdopterin-containing oxidoreductase family membrane subunit